MTKRIELDIDQIVSRYTSGESAQVIADTFGVSIGTIDNRLKRAGVAKRPVGRPREHNNDAKICQLYKAEMPITEIMSEAGIPSTYTLYLILERNSVPLRRGSYQKEYTATDATPQHPRTVARKSFIALINRVDTILTVSPDRSDSDIADTCGCLPIFVERQRQFWKTMHGHQTV